MTKNKVVVIAAHMDDEVLGCGGVITRHKARGDKVWVIFAAHRVYGHAFNEAANEREKKHALLAKAILGYDETVFLNHDDERLDACLQDMIVPLERYINRIKPSIVYIPFEKDNNQDHRAVFEACRVVLRPLATGFIRNIYLYEIPSSTEQSPPLAEYAFLPNYYADISKYIKKKLDALKCYRSEQRKYPHPRSGKAVKVLAQKRGVEIGFEYAEAFMTIRSKWS